jgi:hypothetical protein
MGTPVNLEINPDLDSAMYIFDVLFECKVRNMDLIPDSELKEFGSFDTGMELMNRDNMTQMTSANLNIAQMTEHVSKGYTLRFVHDQDVLKIYEYTQHHLQRWVGHIGATSLNGSGIPLDDLIKLDTFCTGVYEQAKYYDEAKLTSIEQRFGTNNGFSAIKKMFSGDNSINTERLEKIGTTHRKGFSELFRDIQMKKSMGMGDGINMPSLNG